MYPSLQGRSLAFADGESVNKRQREGGKGEVCGEHRQRKGWGRERKKKSGNDEGFI